MHGISSKRDTCLPKKVETYYCNFALYAHSILVSMSIINIILAVGEAGLVEGETLGVFEIVLVGFTFVFLVLLTLSFTTSVLGKFFIRTPVGEIQSLVVSESKTQTDSQESSISARDVENGFDVDESNPHHIAVIAAAIHCAMEGRSHRIVSIQSNDSS